MKTKRYLRIALMIAVALNLLLSYKYVMGRYFKYNPDLTFERKSLFTHLEIDTGSIVFIGNSLTRQFELAELFKNLKIRNRGINGDNSAGILNRLQDIIHSQPKKIFIESGINEIMVGTPKEKIIGDYEKILLKLQSDCKVSKIYVQSILPVNKDGLAFENSKMENETVEEVNKNLELFCSSRDITFINLYDNFVLNGQMNPRYCISDGLHISGDGYLLMTSLLQKYVDE